MYDYRRDMLKELLPLVGNKPTLAGVKYQEDPLLSSLSVETLDLVPVAHWPHTDIHNLNESEDV